MSIRSVIVILMLCVTVGSYAFHILYTALSVASRAFLTWNTMQQAFFLCSILFVILLIRGMFKRLYAVQRSVMVQERDNRISAWNTREALGKMHPRDFEQLVADVFEKHGYEARLTPASNDGGKDILLWKGKEFAVVEVKRYNKSSIGRPLIQKLHSAMIDADAHKGYFVTLSRFNANARQYAARHNIELIDGSDLIRMMNA